MNHKRNRLMVVLLCINAILLSAVVLSYTGSNQAYAQVKPHDYLLIPGRIRPDQQIVWIVNLGTFQLTHCLFDKQSKNIIFGSVISLAPATQQ